MRPQGQHRLYQGSEKAHRGRVVHTGQEDRPQIAQRLSKKTDLPVFIAEDPLRAVVRGTGITLKNIERYKSVLVK